MTMMYNRRNIYENFQFLGKGQYGTVFKAKNLGSGCLVAVKKLRKVNKKDKDGVNRSDLREIALLQESNHPNVIRLLDVFGNFTEISLVFDLMETDLEKIIKDKQLVLNIADIKSYISQTLHGLEYLHMNWILHRDLKPNNLLISAEGVLKIGDFGLAKQFGSPSETMTPQVVTRWYRAPVLLFGAEKYATGVDMWAIGCILGELLLRVPIFPGESDLDQMSKIFTVIGNPTEENWPEVKSLTNYLEINSFEPIPLECIFIAVGDDFLDILENLLVLNPLKRKNCAEVLQMAFFSNDPSPTPVSNLPLPRNVERGNKQENREPARRGSVRPRVARRLFI